ncbi:hypothetical protein TTHERM_00571560 (macronuclear) [Tetrahymena thermophila SB210]|uniref:Uncharacterized protein n=1 Tax=Tetrahymena thermophila (strain SB210) TaxID=312017 RepID=Q24I18_TETTS|nr:hypothetical protein TTHERM_00571560 [Tetrahymena thermophila SB210]EAS07420.1 hypothetical protein TTHERM_00571560 [Tetrahymena thermophila SB210]|eukprot:XP_001027662.1 hypothetical protein TTHERM_00571560 [Tetrahymena thermophila SB210]
MNPHEEKIKQYLKKNIKVDVDKQLSQEQKEEFVRRKLFTEQTYQHNFQQKTLFQMIKDKVMQGYGYFQTRRFRMFMKETFPFLAFVSFSTYIIYKMENQFDKMNQSVFKVKTLKEQEIEKENEYIAKALRGEPFSNQDNQITDVPDKRNKYKFEELETDEGIDFDTREDFLDGLRKDYNQGIQIAEEYKEEVFQYAKENKKKIGFGIGLTKEEEDEEQQDDPTLKNLLSKPTQQPKKEVQQKKVKTIKRQTKKPVFDEDDDGYEGFGPSTRD